MPLPVITNVARVACLGFCPSGQPWVNVWHLRDDSGTPWTSSRLTLATTMMRRLYKTTTYSGGAPILAQCKTTVTFVETDIIPLDGTTPTTVSTFADAGTDTGDPLPSEVALVCTLRTAIRGRSHRGRVYLPPFGEITNGSDGRVATGVLLQVNSQMEGWRLDLVTNSFAAVVASYHLSSATTVSAITANNNWDVQRRRK